MKFKTTKKEIKNNYHTIISVGYCSLQHLLNCVEAAAYTAGTNGWCADIYTFGNVAIVTGYAPFGNIKPGYEKTKEYDDVAAKLCSDRSIPYAELKDRLYALIKKFIEEVTE